jgi:hypothetical protein
MTMGKTAEADKTTRIDKGAALTLLVGEYLGSERCKNLNLDASDPDNYQGMDILYADFIGWIYDKYLDTEV